MKLSVILLAAIVLSGCASARQQSRKMDFDRFQAAHPDQVFAKSIDARTRACLDEYREARVLPNGRPYGASVRGYSLRGKSAEKIRSEFVASGCAFHADWIRDPSTNEPKRLGGQPIPMWILLCPDGGVVRIKPEGDPTDSAHPGRFGSKGIRYPYYARFKSFADEVIKVDDEGNAIPKSPRDLAPKELVDGWGEDAHAELGELE